MEATTDTPLSPGDLPPDGNHSADSALGEMPPRTVHDFLATIGIGSRVKLAVAAMVCFALTWSVAGAVGVPPNPGLNSSLLHQSPIVGILLAAVVVVAGVIIGTLIAGSVRLEAGLFAATAGLAALSWRGGPMHYVLFDAVGPGIFIQLAMEMILLSGIVVLGRLTINPLERRGLVIADPHRDGVPHGDTSTNQRMLALSVQVVVTAVLMLFLAQTDVKNQAIASVFVASYLGAVAARAVAPTDPSVWYWTGPLIVGFLGYVLAYSNPQGWNVGVLQGPFAALARPLPLDYASAGPAAALLGYWTGRNWMREEKV